MDLETICAAAAKLADGKLRVLWKHISTDFLFQVSKLLIDYRQACGESYIDVPESLGQHLANLTRTMSHKPLPENGSNYTHTKSC
jgi:hypothetical protein